MKRLVMLFATGLAVAAAVLSACAAPVEAPNDVVKDVTAQQAFTLVQENSGNTNFVVLDVRTPAEYGEGHITGAINVDFNSPDFRSMLDKLDKSKTYLVYCRSGSRSRNTIPILLELGFKDIRHMTGGIIEWDEQKLPKEQVGSSSVRADADWAVMLFPLRAVFSMAYSLPA